jgi:hypothetical protein
MSDCSERDDKNLRDSDCFSPRVIADRREGLHKEGGMGAHTGAALTQRGLPFFLFVSCSRWSSQQEQGIWMTSMPRTRLCVYSV